MQRWALILSAYQNNIECIPGKLNKCADCMSRLPIESDRDGAEEIHSIVETSALPVTAALIAKASAKDSIGQYTGSTVKPRYFCHTDCNSKISLYRLKLLNS